METPREVDHQDRLTDPRTETLVTLARDRLTGIIADDTRGFALVRDRLASKRRQNKWVLSAAGVVAAAATFLMVVGRAHRIPARMGFEIARGRIGDQGQIESGQGARPQLRFEDGSSIGFGSATHARMVDVDDRGARIALDDGEANLTIHHTPSARWTVNAGPYEIRVTGTTFDVQWDRKAATFELRLRHGSVVITGPLLNSGLSVTGGQRVQIRNREGDVAVTSLGSAPTPEAPAPNPEAPPTAPVVLPAPTPRPTASPRTAVPSWRHRFEAGDFQGLIHEAERRGLDRVFAESSAEDLAAIADAARYVRRREIATLALMAQRRRFPRAGDSRDAAFFLGGLAEQAPGGTRIEEAIDWYDKYLNEAPQGAYAAEALGRKMVAVHKQQGPHAARKLASHYLNAHRNGPYAPAAREILEAR